MSEQSAEHDALRATLHAVWLRIHVSRFDEPAPDSFYHGVTYSERIVETFAREQGIPDIRSGASAIPPASGDRGADA